MDTLTTQSAIEYVRKTFWDSFDSVIGAEFDHSDGVAIVRVHVTHKDWRGVADVWIDEESGKLYGEM